MSRSDGRERDGKMRGGKEEGMGEWGREGDREGPFTICPG
jgi:hypothetical protein